MAQRYSRAKLRELILYLATKCSGDPSFDAAKLNWLLYYADFLAYGTLGRAITGAAYVRGKQGPAPRRLASLRDQMVADAELAIAYRRPMGRPQRVPAALRPSDLKVFAAEEVALIDEVVEALRGVEATDVTTVLRKAAGWRFAAQGAEIPYASVFVSAAPLTDDDIARAREIAERYAATAHR
jgi:hypothetical protein